MSVVPTTIRFSFGLLVVEKLQVMQQLRKTLKHSSSAFDNLMSEIREQPVLGRPRRLGHCPPVFGGKAQFNLSLPSSFLNRHFSECQGYGQSDLEQLQLVQGGLT
eukprot:TRINITY_DN23683_c0_g2_i3.p3 TRINITY_DN23683_c0_g2~~TRINITY_DN23683_c0_g2_i3.p3  ORF type:complete len:105 (-),score=11.72 TRINITY_DN23683_c0_g2_i3:1831-2145(-)